MRDDNYIDLEIKILNICLVIVILVIIYNLSILGYMHRDKLDYKEYSYEQADALYEYIQEQQCTIPYESLTNYEIKERVQKILSPTFYIETYCSGHQGKTRPLLRIIEVGDELSEYEYATVLMHEYIHLVLLYGDESLVDFLTVKYLWESDDNYLRRTACWLVKQKIIYDCGNEYDCTAQLIKYFNIN